MGNIQEYKCPCCGGAIHFDSAIQKMKCPYCDTEFEMEALQGYDEALNQEKSDEMVWDTSAGTEWGEGETNGLHTYQCQSCGGEIVGDESMAASACPYCGNPIVVTGQFSGALKPDYVIPFKLDKKAAKAGLMRHLRGNGSFRRSLRIRTILMRSRAFTFLSGCLIQMQMRIFAIVRQRSEAGAIKTIIIRKQGFSW